MSVVALSSKNPYYISREIDWMLMRDAYGGERYVKEKNEFYLPPTATQIHEGMIWNQPGWHAYQAYRTRAVYHELVKPSLMAMLGVMHRKGPDIELPSKIDAMRKSATFNGEDLSWLMQKINEQQMLLGRYGMLLDVETGAGAAAIPYIVGYEAESILNWDSTHVGEGSGPRKLGLVVLNESDFQRRAGLTWTQVLRYRVLGKADEIRDVWGDLPPGNNYVAAEVQASSTVSSDVFVRPSLAGRDLDEIPFVFVGPRDLVPEPDIPVLMPLARMGLSIYRTEADYRQALYMQGQDTLVVIGQLASIDNSRTRVGAFGSIELPANGDAKYIGADSGGIGEMEKAIQNDLKRAAQLGAQLLTERGNEAEAGAALQIRVASRTATLTTVAQAAARGLEEILKHAARWVDADPDQVHVAPNMDFADDPAQAQDLVYLMTAKNMGLTLSKRSVHGWMKKREFTSMEYEEEQREVDDEPVSVVPGTGVERGIPGQGGSAFPEKASTVAKDQPGGSTE